MKRKYIILTVTGLMIASLTACGGNQASDASGNDAKQEEQGQDSQGTETVIQGDTGDSREDAEKSTEEDETTSGVEDQTAESGDFTFADLANQLFTYSSGAGGWSTDFEIASDGSFTGTYHDSDMGSTGEGYEDGTMYLCSFSGTFTSLTRINDYTYEMKMEDLSYDETPGKEEIKDQVKYIYDKAYGLEGTETFKVFLPGAPVSALTEEEYSWVQWANEDAGSTELAEKLFITVIVNEPEEIAMYAYPSDAQTPYEEASQTLQDYKKQYEELEKRLQKETIQSRMNDCATQMYDVSDTCLNEIWSLVKNNTGEEKFNEILNEQRKWIAEKEAAGDEIMKNNDGSSAQMDSSLKMADLTMERCEELLKYLE